MTEVKGEPMSSRSYGLTTISLEWQLPEDSSTELEIEAQVSEKLKKIDEAAEKAIPSTIILWSYGTRQSQGEEGFLNQNAYGFPDTRTVKNFPPTTDASVLGPKAFIEIMRRLGVDEKVYQDPPLSDYRGLTDFGSQTINFRNKVIPTIIPGAFFHIVEEINDVAYAIEVAAVTTGVDYSDKVTLKVGEIPKKKSFIQRILKK